MQVYLRNFTNHFRCDQEYSSLCLGRIDKIKNYLIAIYQLPLKDNFIGNQKSEITLKNELTLSDFSWLEIVHATGIFNLFSHISLLRNIKNSLEKIVFTLN